MKKGLFVFSVICFIGAVGMHYAQMTSPSLNKVVSGSTLKASDKAEINDLLNKSEQKIKDISREFPVDTMNNLAEVKQNLNQAQAQYLALIQWMKNEQILYRNDLARSYPQTDKIYPLDADKINNYRIKAIAAISSAKKIVPNLYIKYENKETLLKKIQLLEAYVNRVQFVELSSRGEKEVSAIKEWKKSMQADIKSTIRYIGVLRNLLNSVLDSKMTVPTTANEVATNNSFISMLLMGLSFLSLSLFAFLNKKKTVIVKTITKEDLGGAQKIAEPIIQATSPVKKEETVSLDGLNDKTKEVLNQIYQPIYVLNKRYKILWQNDHSHKFNFKGADLQTIVRTTYKNELGEKLSSIGETEFRVNVSIVKKSEEDAIFLLELTELKEKILDESTILNPEQFEYFLKQSSEGDQLIYSANKVMAETISSLSYVFKLSGTKVAMHGDLEHVDCALDHQKFKQACKDWLLAIHKYLKDDATPRTIWVNLAHFQGRINIECFIADINLQDENVSTLRKLSKKLLLEDLVVVEQQLAAYKSRLIVRSTPIDAKEARGTHLVLSLLNQNPLNKVLKEARL